MLPATQHPDVSNCRFHHGEIGTVTFAEHGTFNVGRLELAARFDHAALIVDERLSHVEAAPGFLAVTYRQPDPQLTTGLGQPTEFCRTDDQRVVMIALHVPHTHSG